MLMLQTKAQAESVFYKMKQYTHTMGRWWCCWWWWWCCCYCWRLWWNYMCIVLYIYHARTRAKRSMRFISFRHVRFSFFACCCVMHSLVVSLEHKQNIPTHMHAHTCLQARLEWCESAKIQLYLSSQTAYKTNFIHSNSHIQTDASSLKFIVLEMRVLTHTQREISVLICSRNCF